MKQCRTCKVFKPFTEFRARKDSRDGYRAQCNVCYTAIECINKPRKGRKLLSYRATLTEILDGSVVNSHCRRYYKYKLTNHQYDALLNIQNSSCAICKESVNLVVDHNHITNEVRGLLCADCNLALGRFKDSPASCLAAAEYLKNPPAVIVKIITQSSDIE